MKILISILMTMFAGAAFASPLEFSPYACYYMKMGDTDWKLLTGQSTAYVTKMDWNQTSLISKSKLVGNPESGFGICSEVSSASPEETFVNIYLVEGANLDFASDGCLFSGSEVKVTRFKEPIARNPQYNHVVHKFQISGIDFQLLHVAGLSPSPVENSADLCAKNFKEIFPDASLSNETSASFGGTRLQLKRLPGSN